MSDTLSCSHALNLLAAASFAWEIGLPLNRHITIHWEQLGVSDRKAGAATSRFLRFASQWIATRGGRFACVYVRENGAGKGSHVHILAHVPRGLSLGGLQLGWLRRITGHTYVSRGILTKRVGGTCAAADAAPARYLLNLGEVIGYQLKGASADVADQLKLTRQRQHGRVIGNRAGASQNLGKAARRHSGRAY